MDTLIERARLRVAAAEEKKSQATGYCSVVEQLAIEAEMAEQDRDEARGAARRLLNVAWFLAVQIRRDTGQAMEHTEAEIQRLERAHPWLKEE